MLIVPPPDYKQTADNAPAHGRDKGPVNAFVRAQIGRHLQEIYQLAMPDLDLLEALENLNLKLEKRPIEET
jgi:hypothetical protein